MENFKVLFPFILCGYIMLNWLVFV